MAVVSTQAQADQLAKDLGWTIRKGLKVFAEEFSPANAGVIEAIVPPHSDLTGHTMGELDFRDRYQVNPLAIYRGDEILVENINTTKLKTGDALLLAAPWEKFHILKKNTNLLFTEELRGESTVPEKVRLLFSF